MTKGLLVVLSAPSGAGKSTLCRQLVDHSPDLSLSISHTTRAPRGQETSGKEYVFQTREEFEDAIQKDLFVEWAKVHDQYYGTPRQNLVEKMAQGRGVVLDIDPQGGMKIKEQFPESVLIFIVPPSWEELENRLRKRAQDSGEAIAQRLQNARQEMTYLPRYDYVIENIDLKEAYQDLSAIIRAESRKVSRLTDTLTRLNVTQEETK